MSKLDLTAVVTGAGSPRGIGRATARRLGRDGFAVAVLDLDGEAAARVAAEIADEFGVQVFSSAVDVTNEESVAAAISALESEMPPIGALANIAGITSPIPFFETTLAEWNRVMTVNATGTYIVTKRVARSMVNSGYGRIVTMSSVSAIRGGGIFGKVPYSSAKAAILGFTRAVARELGPTGVTINAIAPGVVDTDIRAAATSPEIEAALAADVPLGRQGTVDDIASLISFLLGKESGYLTGTTIDINGGSHIH
jgi:2-hydroxycyclohexanecarboxyl-CoA dehydrogenase